MFSVLTDQDWLIVQAHLLEAVRAGSAGVWAAHHADNEVDLGVPVLGVGEGAGLHDVAVTLSRSVLTLELVATINLRGLAGRTGPSDFYRIRIRSYLSEPIRVEVHSDIRAKSLVHRAQLLGDKPGAVRTETLIVDIQAELG